MSVKLNFLLGVICLALIGCGSKNQSKRDKSTYTLDMVFNNPGEAETVSKYTNPKFVKSRGINGMVPQWFVNCAITYDNFQENIIPKDSDTRKWINEKAKVIDAKLATCEEAGMPVYAFTDVFMAPKEIWEKFGDAIGQEEKNHSVLGSEKTEVLRRPSIQNPIVQDLMRAQIAGIFERFPTLDGLVIRFGETYLHDTPYHLGGKPVRQGEGGVEDHVLLLNILRDEICVKRNKKLFYRTWDFGWLHTRPNVYLDITNQLEPHENLVFSIKHTKGDFLRNHAFNPTLGIGNHQQIVEVQCQREYEGKGAHPNYVAKAVIDGFEEYEGRSGMQSLNDLKSNKNFKGVWTWSRGGGWKGPYISNELWIDLNTYVMSQWSLDKSKSEEELFFEYAKMIGLSDKDAQTFRQISLLSAKGILRGHYSTISGVHPTWIRDEFMGGLGFDANQKPTKEASGKLNRNFYTIVEKGLTDAVINEKLEAVKIWEKIESLSKSITSGPIEIQDYIKVSSTYGRIKYEIIAHGWTVMLKGVQGDVEQNYQTLVMEKSIDSYKHLWQEFQNHKVTNKQSATLYKPYDFDLNFESFHGENGMDKTVKYYENKIK